MSERPWNLRNPTIQMMRLGNLGRWGNCLFQYIFLQIYAEKYDLQIETTRFPGQDFLHYAGPELHRTVHRPWFFREPIIERYAVAGDCNSAQLPPDADEYVNRDFVGYAQFRTDWYAPYKQTIQKMWTPTFVGAPDEKMFAHMDGHTCIGLHYRAGDFVTYHRNMTNAFRPPRHWYMQWLDRNWSRFKNPRLYVSVEEPQYLEWFRDYNPCTATDVGLSNHYVAEWAMLSYCDVIVMPNSTFSFTAAMANQNLQEAWRATLPAGGFERFDPWCDTPMRYERGCDYPHLRLDND